MLISEMTYSPPPTNCTALHYPVLTLLQRPQIWQLSLYLEEELTYSFHLVDPKLHSVPVIYSETVFFPCQLGLDWSHWTLSDYRRIHQSASEDQTCTHLNQLQYFITVLHY